MLRYAFKRSKEDAWEYRIEANEADTGTTDPFTYKSDRGKRAHRGLPIVQTSDGSEQ